MSPQLSSIIAALRAFVPDENDDNCAALYEMLDGLSAMPQRELAIPAMFALIERFPSADLGSPGPLVHEIEAISGYEPFLLQSLERSPTPLAVWMVNRILNVTRDGRARERWLDQLELVASNSSAPEVARSQARGFLEFQGRQ